MPCRAVRIAPITVIPSSPATSRAALKIPDATPACSTGIAPSTIAVSGTDSPPPMPMMAKLGMSARNEASRPSRLTVAMPIAISSIAAATERYGPTRAATFSATTALTAMSSAIGTNAAPASVGEKPSTFCR